jgi:hypothetical protein
MSMRSTHEDRTPTRNSRGRRAVAAAVVATLAVTGVNLAAAESAHAASQPLAQSVGRFLDGALGTHAIQELADVKDARAVAPGTQSTQNPLDVTLLSKLELPLTGALQLPQLLGINLGAANQVAVAHTDGYSYGASGAVANSGGVSVGGDNNAFPASATIKLNAASIAGNTGASVPGGGTANALGEVDATIGAVSALASTPVGVAKGSSTQYNIGDVTITAASPLVGQLLGSAGGLLGGLLTPVLNVLGQALPGTCPLLSNGLPNLSLEGGAITVNSATGALTISLANLLTQLHLGDLNSLPANTDLLQYLLNYITDPSKLATALADAITGAVKGVTDALVQCVPQAFKAGVQALVDGTSTLATNVHDLVTAITAPLAGHLSALSPLATTLKKLLDIGVNVQPNGPSGDYTDALKATPDQATAPVAHQTVVRAIEVNLLGTVSLALANAAAGPSSAAAASPTATVAPTSTSLPTGVPAGFDKQSSTTTPLVLLLVGLFLAGGGAMAFRLRGRRVP